MELWMKDNRFKRTNFCYERDREGREGSNDDSTKHCRWLKPIYYIDTVSSGVEVLSFLINIQMRCNMKLSIQHLNTTKESPNRRMQFKFGALV